MNSHEELISAIDDEVLRLLKRVNEIIGDSTTDSSSSRCSNNNNTSNYKKEKKNCDGTESPPQVLDQSSLEQNEGVARCA